tara:strand:+ start:263 stop:529 length:267 start_codon:yes stop_codon:yes gene_type:complete
LIEESYQFLQNPYQDMDKGFDAAAYYVAKHYRISIQQVWDMSMTAFEKSFVWANAADRVKAEEMEKSTAGAKNKTRVGSTHGEMPFSE